MGGTAAIFTDPLIIIAGILIGIFLPKKDIKMFLTTENPNAMLDRIIYHTIK